MRKFLERCQEEGIKLNKEKIDSKVESITFMGHKITKNGLEVDDEKVRVIRNFPAPVNTTQLRSFLGSVNFLAKYVPNTSTVLHPLNNLLVKDVK